MDQVLHRLEHHRSLAALQVEQSLDAQQVRPAQRHQRVERALEHRPLQRLLLADHEACDAVRVRGFRDQTGVPRRGRVLPRIDQVLGIDLAVARHVDVGARIERLELGGERLLGSAVGEVDLGDHQTVGEDRLLARFGRLVEIAQAVDRVDQREHHLDRELAAERAIGRECLQDRADVGEPAGFDQHPAEMRNFAAFAVGDQLAQRDLQIRAGVAADAAVAEQRDFVGARAQQRVVDADRAELVDDQCGVAALRRAEEAAHQRRFPRAKEAGDDRHRHPRSALALLPPAEAARSGRREKAEDGVAQKSISRQYRPPMWRSTQYTISRSSTNTSLIWVVPVGAPGAGGGTKVATACG